MDLFFAWLLLASVQMAATMSPGPAFVVCVRNAMGYGRKTGICTAFGLALGVGMHVLFVLAGISFLIAQSVLMFTIIKYAGAAYLFYIGAKSILAMKKKKGPALPDLEGRVQGVEPVKKQINTVQAIMNGALTNLLNPKAVVFFTAVYTQFVDPSTPLSVQALYGGTSVIIEFFWFSGVAIVLTHNAIKTRFMKIMHWVEGACGGLMIGLGVKLALSKS